MAFHACTHTCVLTSCRSKIRSSGTPAACWGLVESDSKTTSEYCPAKLAAAIVPVPQTMRNLKTVSFDVSITNSRCRSNLRLPDRSGVSAEPITFASSLASEP